MEERSTPDYIGNSRQSNESLFGPITNFGKLTAKILSDFNYPMMIKNNSNPKNLKGIKII